MEDVAVELPLWLEELRRTEVSNLVRSDPRSSGNTTFGLNREQALDAISWGQADFDAPHGHLTADDLALLYAYWNQKGHLEELVEAFRQCFAVSNTKPNNPIVVDVGCGPFTGGLALATSLGEAPFDYIGVDRADSMRRLGQRLADSALVPGQITCIWAADMASVEWAQPPRWRDVLVIVSFVFASPSLDVGSMCDDLIALLRRLGNGSVTVLYTNSVRAEANRGLPEFDTRLKAVGFRSLARGKGEIGIARSGGSRVRGLWYAIFHRPRQTSLSLEGA